MLSWPSNIATHPGDGESDVAEVRGKMVPPEGRGWSDTVTMAGTLHLRAA